MERNVTPDHDAEVFNIDDDFVTFDEVTRRIERYAIELSGRGVAPPHYMDAMPKHARGSVASYDLMVTLQDALEKTVTEDDPAIALLSPLLTGLEGHRVHAITLDGDERFFTVARTEGLIPTHIERTDQGDRPADDDYKEVRVHDRNA